MKKCIFHYPRPIAENPTSGSEVRPNRMLNAFKEIGYDVELVTGFSPERHKAIQRIKKNIKAGIKYNFVYSENTSMPTALSDADHMPRHPFQDELFLAFCRKNGIPVGLFYRDAYWKFPLYKESVKWWTPAVTVPFYKHELGRYNYCTDVLFVPSIEFADAIGYKGKFKELPPGGDCVLNNKDQSSTVENGVNIFYVGGVTGLYNITMPLQVISKMKDIHLTLCCSERDWESNLKAQEIVKDSSNISVIHKTKKDLEPYYNDADIALAFFERNSYRDLAMPVKIFEYIGYGKPIITTTGTAAGRFIADNEIGWALDYSAEELIILLNNLKSTGEIQSKKGRVEALAINNTWSSRAETVAEELTKHI